MLLFLLDGSVVETVLVGRGDLSALVSLGVCVGCDVPTVDDTLVVVLLDPFFFLSILAVVAARKSDGRRDSREFFIFRDDARSFEKQLFFDTNADREWGEQNAATPSIFGLTTQIHRKKKDDGTIIRTMLTVERNDSLVIVRFGVEYSDLILNIRQP
jgi:hypothetical protein